MSHGRFPLPGDLIWTPADWAWIGGLLGQSGVASGASLALWHGHEMLFGYAVAVIAGFLLTAVRNWTNQPTPTGAPLMALAALWVAGRILVLTPWGLAAALVNAAFPVAVAVAMPMPVS